MASEVDAANTPAPDQKRANPRFKAVRFWMVWNKNGGPPKVTHDSYEAAARAAVALARKHPGEKFIVLRAERKFWFEAPDVSEAQQDAEAAAAMRSAA